MEVAPGVFHLNTSRASNCFLIREPICTIVHNCLPRHEGRVAAQLSKLGVALGDARRLILTHWHLDHSSSAEAWRRASSMEMYLHALDEP